MNRWDFLLLLLIALIMMLAIRKMVRDRKKGKGCMGCGGNCANCSIRCGNERKDGNA